MENRRRIGNDYTFTWPFEVRTGEQTTEPYDLTGKVFQLYMVGRLETIEIPADEIEVDGNEITWTWHGKDQRYPGLYNAKLVENGGEDGMITVDVKYAVTLVPHTWQEGGSDDGCISLESVELVATEVSMTPGPRGPQGEQGPAGPQGATGPAGPQGEPGTAGPQGPEGKSAYEVAVDNGFEGTEEEWLESLHGGPRGPQGYSAYEVAVNEGYVGTETQWLASLKGETGATGATGPQGPQGETGDPGITSASVSVDANTGTPSAEASIANKVLSIAFHNLKGAQGPKGDDGDTGETGPAGERGGKWLEIASTPTAYTTQVGDFLPSYRVSKSAVLTQAGVDDVIVGDILVNSYYVYGVGYVDNDYVYTTARASIRGEKGATGSAATIAVGTVATGEAGSQAAVNNRGSSSAAVFDFTIPKGDKGDTGETGAKGDKGDKGDTGDPGITGATVSVDSSAGTPSAQASITNKILALAFSGLKGETGPQGAAGASGAAGADGVGIASVVQTVESTTPGGTNVITVTKTDGTTSTFKVRNGDAVGSATIVQTTGNSTTSVMSQDTVTRELESIGRYSFSPYEVWKAKDNTIYARSKNKYNINSLPVITQVSYKVLDNVGSSPTYLLVSPNDNHDWNTNDDCIAVISSGFSTALLIKRNGSVLLNQQVGRSLWGPLSFGVRLDFREKHYTFGANSDGTITMATYDISSYDLSLGECYIFSGLFQQGYCANTLLSINTARIGTFSDLLLKIPAIGGYKMFAEYALPDGAGTGAVDSNLMLEAPTLNGTVMTQVSTGHYSGTLDSSDYVNFNAKAYGFSTSYGESKQMTFQFEVASGSLFIKSGLYQVVSEIFDETDRALITPTNGEYSLSSGHIYRIYSPFYANWQAGPFQVKGTATIEVYGLQNYYEMLSNLTPINYDGVNINGNIPFLFNRPGFTTIVPPFITATSRPHNIAGLLWYNTSNGRLYAVCDTGTGSIVDKQINNS